MCRAHVEGGGSVVKGKMREKAEGEGDGEFFNGSGLGT